MNNIEVTYMSGAGNLFSVVDNRPLNLSEESLSKLAPILCGVSGGDNFRTEGLIALQDGDAETVFGVSFFNPDGSGETMCGNGGRCVLFYALGETFNKSTDKYLEAIFSMAGEKYSGALKENSVELRLPPPVKIETNVKLNIGESTIDAVYVDVNSDHAVVDFRSLDVSGASFDDFDVESLAPAIRNHAKFAPKGANVNIYSLAGESIRLRTFERGVEAETGACGTGAISTAIAAVLSGEARFPVRIIPTSGQELKIDVKGNFPHNIEQIILEGGAEILKKATISIPEVLKGLL